MSASKQVSPWISQPAVLTNRDEIILKLVERSGIQEAIIGRLTWALLVVGVLAIVPYALRIKEIFTGG